MNNTILLALIFFIACSSDKNNEQNLNSETTLENNSSPKSILAIFAHPDDESTVMPILNKYTKEGHHVNLVLASDGRYGVTEHAKIPAGDSLAMVRSGEAKCACEKLGINDPILLGYHDQLNAGDGFHNFNTTIRGITQNVDSLFNIFDPDVIITWGPEGYTGHPDHRLVGSIVTELYMKTDWAKPVSLLYPGLPKENGGADIQWLSSVNKDYLDVRIKVNQDNLQAMKEAWLCHQSQYTTEDIEGMMTMLKSVISDTIYLRSFQPSKLIKNNPFF